MQDATKGDLYQAVDWLLDRKERIEKKLAERHLDEGCLVLFDVTNSYLKGRPLPAGPVGS